MDTIINGWFPAFDPVRDDVSITAAAIHGFIWRECANNGGVCTMSKRAIAAKLKINRREFLRLLKLLVEQGWLEEVSVLPVFDATNFQTCFKLGKKQVSLLSFGG